MNYQLLSFHSRTHTRGTTICFYLYLIALCRIVYQLVIKLLFL